MFSCYTCVCYDVVDLACWGGSGRLLEQLELVLPFGDIALDEFCSGVRQSLDCGRCVGRFLPFQLSGQLLTLSSIDVSEAHVYTKLIFVSSRSPRVLINSLGNSLRSYQCSDIGLTQSACAFLTIRLSLRTGSLFAQTDLL